MNGAESCIFLKSRRSKFPACSGKSNFKGEINYNIGFKDPEKYVFQIWDLEFGTFLPAASREFDLIMY